MIDPGSLRKILDLEKTRGYTDLAVIGGLDRFLRKWSEPAAESITSPALLGRFRKLFGASYASMSPEQREGWVGDALGFLAEVEGKQESPPAVSPEPPPAAKPPPRARKKAAPVKKIAAVSEIGLDSPVTVVRGISTGLDGELLLHLVVCNQ